MVHQEAHQPAPAHHAGTLPDVQAGSRHDGGAVTDILTSAATSAAIAVLIQLAALLQAKTIGRAIQPRTTTRHADVADTLHERPHVDAAEEYPGRIIGHYAENIGTPTAGASTVPPTADAPAYAATHASAPSGIWTSPSWPPLTATDDDTHVTKAVA
jgi:hypothetical protein